MGSDGLSWSVMRVWNFFHEKSTCSSEGVWAELSGCGCGISGEKSILRCEYSIVCVVWLFCGSCLRWSLMKMKKPFPYKADEDLYILCNDVYSVTH